MDYRRRNARGEFMRDRARRRDMRRGRRDGNYENYTSDRNYGSMGREYDGRYNGRSSSRRGNEMEYGSSERYDNYDRTYGSPYYIRGEMGRMGDYRGNDYRGRRDYGYDYADGEEMSESEMKEWHKELMHEIPEQYRELYTKERVEDVARQMNVDFKDFSPLTLAVTTTMLASDYKDVIAPSDIQRYVALGKAWLKDTDSNLQCDEKLSAYYDEVVNG